MRKHVRAVREQRTVLDGIPAQICYKNIKNLYLRVRDGYIELSVPQRTAQRDLENFVRRRRAWIDERLRLLRARAERPVCTYAAGERIRLWGQEYPIVCVPLTRGKAYAEYANGTIVLHAAQTADVNVRRAAIGALYRAELVAAIEREAPSCETVVGKYAALWRIRAMKTRWGSCNVRTAAITLNLQLAQYDVRALRYVITHELTHLWVRGHDGRFYARMDRYFPNWQNVRRELNAWAQADL
ncbi:M48 family metallopeptidase [Selenomonas infelix]|uniref:M48 family metallopeptidase n=1 Tax=Selenomonas infelix TaxID=135082 RepID=UPI000586DFF6|nr:SprT family zinc-dependent metalloprotease [Selenomonas infelix]